MPKDWYGFTSGTWTCQPDVVKKAAVADATKKAETSAMSLVASAATFITTASMM